MTTISECCACWQIKGGAESPELNSLAREFALDQALRSYRLTWLEHIPDKTNLEADALSRLAAPTPAGFPETLHSAERSEVTVERDFGRVELN